MARRNWYGGAIVIALLTLALTVAVGCGGEDGSPAAVGDTAANTVTTSGTGEAHAAPDMAEMTFGVTITSANAKRALDDASKVAERIAAALKKQGIDAKDLQTQDVSIYPQYGDQGGKEVVTGYEASLSVRAKVRNIAKLGEVIAAATAAGANDISGPTFSVQDPAQARQQAIEEAVGDARTSAEAMAKAAGKSVGSVLSMSFDDAGVAPEAAYEYDMGDGKAAPIEPGEMGVTVTVRVVFELK